MDERQAFKYGFMHRCIEQGLTTPAEMLKAAEMAVADLRGRLVEKVAIPILSDVMDMAKSTAGTALSWGLPAAAIAPPLIGAIGGSLLAKGNDIDDYDVDEAKKQEIAETYKREAGRLRRQGLLRRYHQQKPPSAGRPMF